MSNDKNDNVVPISYGHRIRELRQIEAGLAHNHFEHGLCDSLDELLADAIEHPEKDEETIRKLRVLAQSAEVQKRRHNTQYNRTGCVLLINNTNKIITAIKLPEQLKAPGFVVTKKPGKEYTGPTLVHDTNAS